MIKLLSKWTKLMLVDKPDETEYKINTDKKNRYLYFTYTTQIYFILKIHF